MHAFSRKLAGGLLAAGVFAVASAAAAEEVIKIGFVGEMSGSFAEFGRQMQTGIRAYQKQHGDTVAGKRIEVVYRDVGGPKPELAKRLAQELVVRDKVQVLAGFGFTPNAAAVAPVATEAKVPMVVMNAAAGGLTKLSPYMARVSFTYPDMVPPIAEWAVKQGYKRAYVLVADYAPGLDVEAAFMSAYKKAGGEVIGNVRVPMTTVEFAPYLQKVKDLKPDVLFSFVNAGDVSPAFMKEFRARGLDQAGIKLIGTGDIVMENSLKAIGDNGLGVVSVYPYSALHGSELNQRFAKDFVELGEKHEPPTIMGVAAYDGMAAIYAALRKTGGKADGESLMAALKGVSFESPRGPLSIDASTGDVVQNHYIRRLEKVGTVAGAEGGLGNVEFETFAPAR